MDASTEPVRADEYVDAVDESGSSFVDTFDIFRRTAEFFSLASQMPSPVATGAACRLAEGEALLDEYDEFDIGADIALNESPRKAAQRVISHVLRTHMQPARVKMRDKLVFVASTCSLAMTTFWLGHDPATFHRLYLWTAGALFSLRSVSYRWRRAHYYLLDFCYMANALLMFTLACCPTNLKLLKVCFAYSFGPLAWSVLTFRNSLVFHSVDKITSVFLHIYPACACWAVRFHPPPALRPRLEADPGWARVQAWDIVFLPMLPYLLWATLYYCKVFIVSSERIRARGYGTLFKLITKSPSSFYSRAITSCPENLQPAVYMLFHVVMTTLTMALCAAWWASETAASAFIVTVFGVASWNGANFYFEVFAKRYLRDLGLSPAAAAAAAGGGSARPSAPTGPGRAPESKDKKVS